jgi:hypothetical protein
LTDDGADPIVPDSLGICRSGKTLLQLIGGDSHKAEGNNFPRIVETLSVEDSCRYSEALVRLPLVDEILERPAFLEAPDKHADDHEVLPFPV